MNIILCLFLFVRVYIVEDHEKLEKILQIRKRREDKADKKHMEKQKEVAEYETMLEGERNKVEQFIKDKTIEMHEMQNKIRTEAVTGLEVEKYLLLKEKTKKDIEEMYQQLEEKSKGHIPLIEEVNELFKQWDDTKKGRMRLEDAASQKTEEYTFEKDQEEEAKMFDDFVFKPKH